MSAGRRLTRFTPVALLGSLLSSPIAMTAEPVAVRDAVGTQLTPFKIHWNEQRREQNLRERMLRIDRLTPRLQAMANALWRDTSQNGFSLDVDPGDEEVILRYRIRF